jgi:hypothetical protein
LRKIASLSIFYKTIDRKARRKAIGEEYLVTTPPKNSPNSTHNNERIPPERGFPLAHLNS